MFHMTDLAVGALPAARGACHYLTRCWDPSVPCHLSGPAQQACYHHSVACHGPYSGPVVEAGLQPQACPYPGAYGNMYPAAGQGPAMQPMAAGPYAPAPQIPAWCDPGTQMYPPPAHPGYPHPGGPHYLMANQLQPGIPPYCNVPTYLCVAFHSHHVTCLVSVFYDQALPAAALDPAMQLGMLQEQMMVQLGAGQAQQPGMGQGMAPRTVAETDRLIEELERTIQQLRAHRAALERLAGG